MNKSHLNTSIDAKILNMAKQLGINCSEASEEGLRLAITRKVKGLSDINIANVKEEIRNVREDILKKEVDIQEKQNLISLAESEEIKKYHQETIRIQEKELDTKKRTCPCCLSIVNPSIDRYEWYSRWIHSGCFFQYDREQVKKFIENQKEQGYPYDDIQSNPVPQLRKLTF